MGDTFITDMTHFEGIPSGPSHEPARKFARFFGSIVSTATISPADISIDSALSCRRRPGRRPCTGHLKIYRDMSGVISWHCSWCNDQGEIRNWKGTTWDLSTWAFGRRSESGFHELILSEEELRELMNSVALSPGSLCLLFGAVIAHGGIVIRGTLKEFEALEEEIAADANHEKKRSRQKILDHVYERIESLFDQEDYYGSDIEEMMENEQQELSPKTETFFDEWERKMNQELNDAPVCEGVISSEIIEKTWQKISGSSVKKAQKLINRMSEEQPFVLAYLLGVDDDIFSQYEREDLIFLGVAVWQVMLQGDKPLPKVTDTMLKEAEDNNFKLVERLNKKKGASIEKASMQMIESHKQPEILKYLLEAIMEETDTNSPDSDDHGGLMFIDLKTVLDCFCV